MEELYQFVEQMKEQKSNCNYDELCNMKANSEEYISCLLHLQYDLKNRNMDQNICLLVHNLQMVLLDIQSMMRHKNQSKLTIYTVRTEFEDSIRGRSKIKMQEEILLYFRSLGFKWRDIALMLLVSRWTVWRRVRELGISDITGYFNISETELDDKIT